MKFLDKKKAVKIFFEKLSNKLDNFYISFNDLSLLSKRRIFKLLVLTYKAEGKEYDKDMLKDLSYVIANYNVDFNNKKHIKVMYKIITTNDIVDYIDSAIVENLFTLVSETNKWSLLETASSYNDNKMFLSLGTLLL